MRRLRVRLQAHGATDFHGQLKRLWEITPFLKAAYGSGPEIGGYARMTRPFHDKEPIAKQFSRYGFNFLPLVTADLGLLCWLDILYLRRQPPGEVWQNGDIDNRLKTLFDCLAIPDDHQEYERIKPCPDETPFYCLLENDTYIPKITVETDRLLEDLPGDKAGEKKETRRQ